MLKVRRTRKAGHDVYTDNSQMTREEGAVACGLWPVASRGLRSEPGQAAALQRALRAALVRAQGHARSGPLSFITAQPVPLQPLYRLAQHSSHVIFWQGLPVGSVSVSVALDFHTMQRSQKSLFKNKAS